VLFSVELVREARKRGGEKNQESIIENKLMFSGLSSRPVGR